MTTANYIKDLAILKARVSRARRNFGRTPTPAESALISGLVAGAAAGRCSQVSVIRTSGCGVLNGLLDRAQIARAMGYPAGDAASRYAEGLRHAVALA